jgi:hypothetical protein
MNRKLVAAGLVAAAVVGAGGWYGYRALGIGDAPVVTQAIPEDLPDPEPVGDVETVDATEVPPVDAGSTPMRERVAVLGLLNKRNGVSRDVTLRPGQAVRLGDTVVRLRACERTAPWEAEELTGSFVQFDVREADAKWRRAFSGWLFKERPALNVVQHPVYDVWTKSCTMSFPEGGADTVVLDAPDAPGKRSSAPKSPAPGPERPRAPSAPDSAVPNRET